MPYQEQHLLQSFVDPADKEPGESVRLRTRSAALGFTLLGVLVAMALFSFLAIVTSGWFAQLFRLRGRLEDDATLIEMRDYFRANTGCKQTLLTYFTPNGDTSVCRYNSERALVKRDDGTVLISDTQYATYSHFELRARCSSARSIQVDFRDIRSPGGSVPPGQSMRWRPLFKGNYALCDEAQLLSHPSWGKRVMANSTPEPLDDPTPSDTSMRVTSVTGTLGITDAYCGVRNHVPISYYSGFVNCPSGYVPYQFHARTSHPGAFVTSIQATSGAFVVSCGSGGLLSLDCSSDYSVGPLTRDFPRDYRVVGENPVHVITNLTNTFATCHGPDANLTYNSYAGRASCAPISQVDVKCDHSGSRLLQFGVNSGIAQGTCCSSTGEIHITCYQDSAVQGSSSPPRSIAGNAATGGAGSAGATPTAPTPAPVTTAAPTAAVPPSPSPAPSASPPTPPGLPVGVLSPTPRSPAPTPIFFPGRVFPVFPNATPPPTYFWQRRVRSAPTPVLPQSRTVPPSFWQRHIRSAQTPAAPKIPQTPPPPAFGQRRVRSASPAHR